MDLIAANVSVIGVIAIIIALLALGVFIASRIRRVPPNEALIIVGRGAGQKAQSDMTGQRVVIGGRSRSDVRYIATLHAFNMVRRALLKS